MKAIEVIDKISRKGIWIVAFLVLFSILRSLF